jgi:hypothetical protein
MSHKVLSYAYFNELLSYYKQTGKIYQKKKRPKVAVGSEAGTITPSGYRYVQLFGHKYPIHHLVWLFETKSFPEKYLDHKDGNPLNNKFTNLREVTIKQNTENRGKQKNNKTGFKGVSFNNRLQKYVSQIQHNSQTIYLGVYKTPEEASLMYQAAAKVLFSHYKKQ